MSHARMSQEPEQVAGLGVPAPEGFSKRPRIELSTLLETPRYV